MLRQNKKSQRFTLKTIVSLLFVVTFLLGTSQSLVVVQAQTPKPPEEPARGLIPESLGGIEVTTAQTGSVGIATGDPDGPHSVYAWPYTVVQMGHVIQSYQNYSSGTSAAYFHHGIDSIAPNGTDVFTRSGGQVVNVENYQPGNDLYWEVAILDPEGYVWQYHHIDKNTIPQGIKDAFTAWKANHATGGFVPANTYIGDIVYWTVTSFGYRFNHTHINILGAGDVYLNPLEFMTPLNDTQVPQIQAIGLLNGNTLVSGNVATGNYGLYVRARDLFLSTVYYLPPYKTEFSMDGGAWTTVWEFDDLPGGASDTTFVNDFYVAPPTCGNYSCRDFYIDLGFTPAGQRAFPNTEGAHSVQVRVWDYNGNATTSVFNYTYDDPNNHAPVANAQSVSTNEDVAKTITLTGSDVDGDALTYSVVTNPTHGTLSGTAPNLTYTPAANYNGADSFTFKVNDGKVDSAVATVSITVNAVNDAPLANSQSVSTNEDVAKSITLTGSDVDLDTLTYVVVANPAHGALSGTAPNLSYTPEENFNGSDSFTFKVNDGTVDSAPTTVSITVNAVNDAPVANAQSVSTDEDVAKTITLTGSDVDGDALTYSVVTNPTHGTLSGTAPNLTYTPAANYNGTDSFTFKVNDSKVDSTPATSSLTVNAVNDAPVANTQSVSTNEDVAKAITLTGSDVDGDPLDYSMVTNPAHGTLSGLAPNLSYTPEANYHGSDSFTFKVFDGWTDSNIATVAITVLPVNDAPVAYDQSINVEEDTAKVFELWGDDIDGDELTFTMVDGPLHGELSGDALNMTYTPVLNYNGADSFTFKVSDGVLESEVGTVSINVIAMVDGPVADAQSVEVNEDESVAITLTGTSEGEGLYFYVVSDPAHGTLSGLAPNLSYTPEANYNGSDSFTFKVFDGWNDSNIATVAITVLPVNDAPVAYDQSINVEEDTAKVFELWGEDIDGDELTFTVVDEPLHGELSGDALNMTYTPALNYNGADSFTFKVSDGVLESEVGTVSINVIAMVDGPVADAQSVEVNEDGNVAITLTGTSEGEGLYFYVVSDPAHGTLSGLAPNLSYTPEANYNGSDSFTFKVFDGWTDSNIATVAITVLPVNDAPVAQDQETNTDEDLAKAITLTALEVDEDTLNFIVVDGPSHGALSGTGQNLEYTPAVNYFGADSFTFKVNDGQVDSAPATVLITVNSVNDIPVANAQSVSVDENGSVAITLTGSDADGDDIGFTVLNGPLNGILSGSAPDLTYTPAAGYSGSDSFTFDVNDGEAYSEPAIVSITVNSTGPTTVFFDDFENDLGWIRNPNGTDRANSGRWTRDNPTSTYSNGIKQLGTTVSGSYDLVTGPLAGSNAGSYDVDGGITTIRSPYITLPTGKDLVLSFSYYFAHLNNSSSADYLRVKIVGATTTRIFQELGASNDDDAAWETFSVNLNSYAGQTVYILIEAADLSYASLVEAAVDDVLIIAR